MHVYSGQTTERKWYLHYSMSTVWQCIKNWLRRHHQRHILLNDWDKGCKSSTVQNGEGVFSAAHICSFGAKKCSDTLPSTRTRPVHVEDFALIENVIVVTYTDCDILDEKGNTILVRLAHPYDIDESNIHSSQAHANIQDLFSNQDSMSVTEKNLSMKIKIDQIGRRGVPSGMVIPRKHSVMKQGWICTYKIMLLRWSHWRFGPLRFLLHHSNR